MEIIDSNTCKLEKNGGARQCQRQDMFKWMDDGCTQILRMLNTSPAPIGWPLAKMRTCFFYETTLIVYWFAFLWNSPSFNWYLCRFTWPIIFTIYLVLAKKSKHLIKVNYSFKRMTTLAPPDSFKTSSDEVNK